MALARVLRITLIAALVASCGGGGGGGDEAPLLNIIANASTVNGTPPATVRVVAPTGARFRAVAVKP